MDIMRKMDIMRNEKIGTGSYHESRLIEKYIVTLILLFALSLPISGCAAAAGDSPLHPLYGDAAHDVPVDSLVNPGTVSNSTRVFASPGRSVMGISVRADEIVTSSPEARELFIQGLYYVNNNNRFDDALECLNKSLDIDPTFTEAWYVKGVALHNLGRYQNAQYCFDRAIALEPFNISIWSLKGVTIFDAIMHLF